MLLFCSKTFLTLHFLLSQCLLSVYRALDSVGEKLPYICGLWSRSAQFILVATSQMWLAYFELIKIKYLVYLFSILSIVFTLAIFQVGNSSNM